MTEDIETKEELIELQRVMDKLDGPLWKRRQSQGVSPNDVQPNRWAVTVNIQPTKLMNKRQWRKYSPDQQIAILGRVESAFRKKTPSVQLIELHYETCPVLGNIHFHALYDMPAEFKAELETYYKRVCDSEDENTKVKWRYLDIKPITSEDGWIQYIRKDINI